MAHPVVTVKSQEQPAPVPGGNAPGITGERFFYRVDWNPPWYLFFLPKMEAGELEVAIADESIVRGKRVLRIVFRARSSGSLVKLAGIKVEDDFEFFTDPATLCTVSVNKKLREGKRKRDITITYFPEEERLHIKEMDVAVSPPKIRKDEFRDHIPPCVKDVFSALLMTRRQDLFVGAVHQTTVGDNDRVKEVETRVEKKERIETPAGRFDAWQISTMALVGGLFREGGTFKIWLTADDRKMPVQFEAKVSFGTVIGKLKNQPTETAGDPAGVGHKPNSVSPF